MISGHLNRVPKIGPGERKDANPDQQSSTSRRALTLAQAELGSTSVVSLSLVQALSETLSAVPTNDN